MSKIARKPIDLKGLSNINILPNGYEVTFLFDKKNYSFSISSVLTFSISDNDLFVVSRDSVKNKEISRLLGLNRSLLVNYINGIKDKFKKTIILSGVGFKSVLEDSFLILSVGFSHLIRIEVPHDIEIKIISAGKIDITSSNKDSLGRFINLVKSVRPVEPYKARGIYEEKDFVLRKSGKSKG